MPRAFDHRRLLQALVGAGALGIPAGLLSYRQSLPLALESIGEEVAEAGHEMNPFYANLARERAQTAGKVTGGLAGLLGGAGGWMFPTKKSSQHGKLERDAELTGAGLSGLGGAAILGTGVGKAAPSHLDLATEMFKGPSGPQLFEHLATIDPQGARQLQKTLAKSPFLFKSMLAGFRLPGIPLPVQQEVRRVAFAIQPGEVQTGDVLNWAPHAETKGWASKLRHALSGGTAQHTALGEGNSTRFYFLAGRGQGAQNYSLPELDREGFSQAVLRPKQPVDAGKVSEGLENAFAQPYNYALRNRLAAHEALSFTGMDKSRETALEHFLTGFSKNKKTRRLMPGAIGDLMQSLSASRRLCNGHVCSTAVAEALRNSAPGMLGSMPTKSVAPLDFARRIGKDFDVVSNYLPEAERGTKALLGDAAMKFAPMALRAGAAAPFLGAAYYLANKARGNEQPGMLGRVGGWFAGKEKQAHILSQTGNTGLLTQIGGHFQEADEQKPKPEPK